MGGFRRSARTGTIPEFLPTIVLIAFAHPAVVAIASIVIKAVTQKEALKILDIGSAVLFGGLPSMRCCGLLAIVLVSILIGQPFTLQYASGDARVWHAHRVISLAWAAAFAGMAATNLFWLTHPDQRAGRMLLLTVALGYAAFRFTQWYPRYLGLRGPAQPAG